MSTTPHSGSASKWLVPALVIVAAALLIGIVWLINTPNGGEVTPSQEPTDVELVPTQPESDGAPTEIQQPQMDLTQFERRDAADLLSAGPVDAPVALVVFSDYQCGFCAKWSDETLPLMLERAEAGELRIEWRDVNIFGEDSERAALASYAAAQQGAFWEFHEALFPGGEKLSDLSEAALISLADSLGLDTAQFSADMASDEAAAEIAQNAKLGLDLGAFSTPSFILGGTALVGAQPTEVFTSTLDAALAG